ncbi:DUF6346 domain-containing protein [Plantactinospora sonchi]|uniref:DUF6346 domain-containing protein n=1 Tax=Plantactinospora sonchi TaxID=1544735 RepID=A0ABU7RT52_9ACTN
MGSDEEFRERLARRRAEIDEQLADLDRADEERAERTRELAARRAAMPRLRRWLTDTGGVLVLLVVVFLTAESAMTVAQFTGPGFDEDRRTGQATVRSCERRGPIGEGFGYWYVCEADVVWSDGDVDRIRPHKRGFFDVSEIGSTVTIGDRGARKLPARADLPPRPLVLLVASVLAMVAVLLSMLLLGSLWLTVKDRVRRLRR